jgi:hypothetical protein
MFCPTLLDPACVLGPVTNVASSAAAVGVLGQLAGAIQSGVAWIVSNTVDWWVKAPSPDLAAEPAVGQLQQWIAPIAVAVAVLGMIAAGGKMALTRKATPLADAGSGLVIIAATSALGVLLPSLLLKAGDAWSAWALNASAGGQFGRRLTEVMSLSGAASGVVIVLGIAAIIISTIQAVLMMFRQAALVVLAGVLPLAAAGTLTTATRTWFRRVTGWMLALIFYKPAAAAVYATAFTMIGRGGDPHTLVMGFAMVVLSLLALPALMRLFTWTTGAVADAAGGGGFLQTAIGGAIAIGALRGSSGGSAGSGAVEQARMMASQLGPPTSGPSGGEPPAGGPHSGGPHGSGPRGAATAGGGAAQTATAAQAAAQRASDPADGPGAPTGAAPARPAHGPAAGGPAHDAAARTAASTAAATAAGTAAGATTGPTGAAATGLASGAAQTGRTAAEAKQPPDQES